MRYAATGGVFGQIDFPKIIQNLHYVFFRQKRNPADLKRRGKRKCKNESHKIPPAETISIENAPIMTHNISSTTVARGGRKLPQKLPFCKLEKNYNP